MSTLDINTTEITSLAAKLERLDGLNDRELEVLSTVFALAGVAAADYSAEVEGFMPTAVENTIRLNLKNLPTYLQPGSQSAGLVNGFSWGLKAGFGDGSVVPPPAG